MLFKMSDNLLLVQESLDSKSDNLLLVQESLDSKSDNLLLVQESLDSKSDNLLLVQESLDSKSDNLLLVQESLDSPSKLIDKAINYYLKLFEQLLKKARLEDFVKTNAQYIFLTLLLCDQKNIAKIEDIINKIIEYEENKYLYEKTSREKRKKYLEEKNELTDDDKKNLENMKNINEDEKIKKKNIISDKYKEILDNVKELLCKNTKKDLNDIICKEFQIIMWKEFIDSIITITGVSLLPNNNDKLSVEKEELYELFSRNTRVNDAIEYLYNKGKLMIDYNEDPREILEDLKSFDEKNKDDIPRYIYFVECKEKFQNKLKESFSKLKLSNYIIENSKSLCDLFHELYDTRKFKKYPKNPYNEKAINKKILYLDLEKANVTIFLKFIPKFLIEKNMIKDEDLLSELKELFSISYVELVEKNTNSIDFYKIFANSKKIRIIQFMLFITKYKKRKYERIESE